MQRAGHHGLAINRFTEPGVEAEIAQDPQMILEDTLACITDKAHQPGVQVLESGKMIGHLERGRIGEERVDGEIASRGVFAPVIGKRDLGMAAVGGDITAQRGDLDRAARQHGGYRAMRKARRHRADARCLKPCHHVFGQQPGGNVDIGRLDAQQCIAHRAADIAALVALGVERGEHRTHILAPGPFSIDPRHASTPSSRRDRLAMIPAVTPQMRLCPHMISTYWRCAPFQKVECRA